MSKLIFHVILKNTLINKVISSVVGGGAQSQRTQQTCQVQVQQMQNVLFKCFLFLSLFSEYFHGINETSLQKQILSILICKT